MINDFIKYCYEQGWSDAIYDSFKYPTLAIHIIFILFHCKRYSVSKIKALVAVFLVFSAGYSFSALLAWIEQGGGNNIVRVYIYLPIFCVIVAKLLKEQPKKMLAMLTPNIALQQVVGHMVCVFPGCCEGYPCSWGVWNPLTDSLLFPIQWLECLVSLAIMLVVLAYEKRNHYREDGKVYPIFLIIYGGTRFLLEFLRDNDKLLLGISNLALHALFMVLVGTIWLMVLYEKNKQQELKQKKLKQKKHH